MAIEWGELPQAYQRFRPFHKRVPIHPRTCPRNRYGPSASAFLASSSDDLPAAALRHADRSDTYAPSGLPKAEKRASLRACNAPIHARRSHGIRRSTENGIAQRRSSIDTSDDCSPSGVRAGDRMRTPRQNVQMHARHRPRALLNARCIPGFRAFFSVSNICRSSIGRRSRRLSSGVFPRALPTAKSSHTWEWFGWRAIASGDRRLLEPAVHTHSIQPTVFPRGTTAFLSLSEAIRSDTTVASYIAVFLARRTASVSRRSDTSAHGAGRICEFVIQY